uniref:Short-chain dehydrogenase n=1 Tax=Globisporangium ultimum (strain ATCC 200006 / CBS 805.95 / DAOM BR144) TaxID=431595 RepID=K3XBW7_GLOUD
MDAKTVLITGSSRGIGLKFVEEYIKLGWDVIATVRNPAKAEQLAALSPYKIVQLDSADENSILSAAKELDGESIDLLINNAGILLGNDILSSTTKEDLLKQFEVNSVGPFLVTRAFIPHLKAAVAKNGSANVTQISSFVGSITLNAGSMHGYRASKTALNMINSCLAVDLKSDNIGSFVVHPGYVATDMNGGVDLVMGGIVIKAISTDTSVGDLIKVIGNFTIANTGKFYNHTGDELPW